MFGIIVYGSLLKRIELRAVAPRAARVEPVRVLGFRRAFDQEPTWRRRPSLDRGVLNVVEHADGAFNGVLVAGLERAEVDAMDQRERGYDRIRIPPTQLQPFARSRSMDLPESVFLYRGKPENRNPRLRPHPSYLRLCVAGAGEWGDPFLREFLDTTFVDSRALSGTLHQLDTARPAIL
jgi:hypothetical protein